MVNTKSIIYRMTINQFDEKDNLGINLIDGDSTLVLFKEGNLYEQLSSSTSEVLQDYDSFNTYIFNKLVPPKMIFINENDFYDFTYENPIYKSTIYFYRSGCEDCKSANRLILNSYFNNHKNSKPLYLLD